jgi:hypothetical protein
MPICDEKKHQHLIDNYLEDEVEAHTKRAPAPRALRVHKVRRDGRHEQVVVLHDRLRYGMVLRSLLLWLLVVVLLRRRARTRTWTL